MYRKTLLAAAAVAVAAGHLVVAPVTDAQAKTLRFADFGPNRGARAGALKWMAAELEKRSGGAMKIKFTWGGALLGAKNSAKGLGAGVADLASIVAVYNPGQLVVYEAVDALMLDDEYATLRATYDLMTTNKNALAEFKKKGIRYFSNYTTGPTQLLSRVPIRTLADLKGKKIRATGGFVRAMNAAGATTISLPQPKVYEALSSKTIDGTTNYWYVIRGYKQYEVAGYATELNLGQVAAFGIAMNAKSYDSLSAKEKGWVDGVGRDFITHMAKTMVNSRNETKAALQKGIDGKKVELIQAPADMKKMLAAEAAKDVQKWLGKAKKKNLDGQAILAEFKKLYDKYDMERKTKGYPWK